VQGPHYRNIALWAIVASVVVLVLGHAVMGSFARAALIGAALLGLLAGLGLWSFLSWVQVPRNASAISALAAAVAVFLFTWLRCRAASLACMRAMENAMLYIPLIVVLVGAFVLYMTDRHAASSEGE
jgi:hypothetical protein